MKQVVLRKSNRSAPHCVQYAPELQVIKTREHRKGLKYQSIPDDVKNSFITEVLKQTGTIKYAAEKFDINFSTAKAILHTFWKDGRVGRKIRRHNKNSCFLKIRKRMKLSRVNSDDDFQVKLEEKVIDDNSVIIKESSQAYSKNNKMVCQSPNQKELLSNSSEQRIITEVNLQKNPVFQPLQIFQNLQGMLNSISDHQSQAQNNYQNFLSQYLAQQQFLQIYQPAMELLRQRMLCQLLMNRSQHGLISQQVTQDQHNNE